LLYNMELVNNKVNTVFSEIVARQK
jgi:hypothetical protein